MNLEQREEIKSEVEEELNLKLNGEGDIVTDFSDQVKYTNEEKETEIK